MEIIRRLREKAYQKEVALGDYSYQASRKLTTGRIYPVNEAAYLERYQHVGRHWASYDIALPHTALLSFNKVLERMLQHNKGINLLDIGCGSGALLWELNQTYGSRVHCVGLSTKDFRHLYYTDAAQNQTYADVLPNENTDYVLGDAQELSRLEELLGTKFDIIVAQGSLHYMADPLVVIKQAYELLKDGGYLFAGLDGHEALNALLAVEVHMRIAGYDLEVAPNAHAEFENPYGNKQSTGGLIVRKTHPTLDMPIRYGFDVEMENGDTEEDATWAVTYVVDYQGAY